MGTLCALNQISQQLNNKNQKDLIFSVFNKANFKQ